MSAANRCASPEETARLLNELHREAIAPNADSLAPIIANGRIAVLVHDPDEQNEEALFALGWDGSSIVFEMSRAEAERVAQNCERQGDHVTARWLRRRGDGRIFFAVHAGSLLVNFTGSGFELEPGSTDMEWMN